MKCNTRDFRLIILYNKFQNNPKMDFLLTDLMKYDLGYSSYSQLENDLNLFKSLKIIEIILKGRNKYNNIYKFKA